MTEGGWGSAGTGQPSPGDHDRRSSVGSKVVIAAIAAVVGIGGGAAGVWLAKGPESGGSSVTSSASPGATPSAANPSLAASQVQLESTSSAGPSPFTTPVGQDQANITPASNTSGTVMGDTPGLFADAGDKPSCDTQTLITNLAADPAKQTAWATALGLQASDLPTYIPSLTPVLLRSDTAVTSYGYADGRFFAYPAVLQAGTAVFVNSRGEPRAKCFSGNPLTKPQFDSDASVAGAAWQGFSMNSVTVIVPPPTVIKEYIFVDSYGRSKHYHKAPPQKYNDDNDYCAKHHDSKGCQPSYKSLTGTAGGGESKCPEGKVKNDKGDCMPVSGSVNSSVSGGDSACPNGQIKDPNQGCVPATSTDNKEHGGDNKCPDGQPKKNGKCPKPDSSNNNNNNNKQGGH